MKLTLVRHTSVDCKPNVCYGQTDVDVAHSFPQEAEKVRLQLEGTAFDAVFSSPLQRCSKLAAYCGYPQAINDKRLMELNFGDWEGIPWNEINDPNLDRWYLDWINTPTTNGESFAEQVERVKNFLGGLKATTHDQVLAFTHAGVIRATAVALGLIDIDLSFSDYSVEYGDIKSFDLP
ncbi:MAG: alpha-ribazole phosphatase [Bacteroidales bacterium 45-6]|nr:MAG: alpha-ribazole phosphatase [Bacteroidales bacterium 45-6]